MSIFAELLDSYSKLRKRRYSLSEAMGGSRELALNSEFPKGTYTPEDLKMLQQTSKGAAGPGPVENAPPYTAVAHQEGTPGMVSWRDTQGSVHSANQSDLQRYLELRLKEEDEDEFAPEGEALEMGMPMPTYEDMLAESFMGHLPVFLRVAKNQSLDLDVDEEFEANATLAFQQVSDMIRDRKGGGREAFRKLLQETLNLEGVEDGEDAIKEFVDDFGDFLDVLNEAANEEEDCFQVKGIKNREKMLNRFFTRDGRKNLIYGSARDDAEKPMLSAGTANLKGRSYDYHGTHFSKSTISPGRGMEKVDNPIFEVLDSLRDLKRCESGAPLITATGSMKNSDWAPARANVDETAPIISDAFVKWVMLPPEARVKHELGEKLVKAMELSLGAIKDNLDNFIELIRDAHGAYDGVEKFFPEAVAEAEEFFEHAFGEDAVLEGLVSDPQVNKLAKLVLASYMIPELEFAATMHQVPGFKRVSSEFTGVPVNALKSYVSPEKLPGRGSHVAEKIKGDSVIVFDNIHSARQFLQQMNSTHTPSRLRDFMVDPGTGEVAIFREHKNVDADRAGQAVQMGRDQLSVRKFFSPEADQVHETHIQVLRELGVEESKLGKLRALRSKEKETYSRVDTALSNANKKPGVDGEGWVKDRNTLDSVIIDLKGALPNLTHPLLDTAQTLLEDLKTYKEDPHDPKQQANRSTLLFNTWNTLNSLDGTQEATREHVRDRAAMALLMGAASTNEKLISFRVGGRKEMVTVPQSVVLDELATNIVNGTSDLEITADSTGFKFTREGKPVAEVRYRYKKGRPDPIMEVKMHAAEMLHRYKGRRKLPEGVEDLRPLIRETIVSIFEEMFVGQTKKIL